MAVREVKGPSTSHPFVHSPNLLLLAQVAETWHCRPSDLLWGRATHFQLDCAAAAALWQWREEVIRQDH